MQRPETQEPEAQTVPQPPQASDELEVLTHWPMSPQKVVPTGQGGGWQMPVALQVCDKGQSKSVLHAHLPGFPVQ